jgi:hypothetical protein
MVVGQTPKCCATAVRVGGPQAGVMGGDLAVQGLGEGIVLGGQFFDASGEALQRGEDRDVDHVPGRPQPGQGVGAGCSFELSVSGTDALGCGDEGVGDLVQGGGACLDGGAGGVVQGAYAGDGLVLRRGLGSSGQCGPGGGVGVDGVGLSDAAAFGPVGPVDLDDLMPVRAGGTGEAGAVGGGAFHSDRSHVAVGAQKSQSRSVSGCRGGELGVGEVPAVVADDRDVDGVGMGVDPAEHILVRGLHELEAVTQPDGRSGRVDILLFRSRRDDNSTERLVIELKRPTVKVGPKELDQIKGYARAIIDDPQYSGAGSKWRFYLVTYDYSDKILRDIRQKDRRAGLADVQDDYEFWVKSWGEILDAGEKKLRFFQEELNYEATDDRVTQHLRGSYSHFIPDALTQPQGQGEAEPTGPPEQEQ